MDDTAHATEEAQGAQNYDNDEEPFLDAPDLAMQAAVELRHCVEVDICDGAAQINGWRLEHSWRVHAYDSVSQADARRHADEDGRRRVRQSI